MNMATYETFAAVYDAVMDDSLYDLWTDFLSGISQRQKIRKITGIGLWDRGFNLFAFPRLGLM